MQKVLKFIHELPNGFLLVKGGRSIFSILDGIERPDEPYSLCKYNLFSNFLQWLNMFGNRTYIVSTYNSYERIHTEKSWNLFTLYLVYMVKGYRTWDWSYKIAEPLYKWFNIKIMKGVNVTFEKFVPHTDQLTHDSTWSDW